MSSKKNVIAIAITTVALTVASVGVGQASSKVKSVSTKVTRTSSTGVANPMSVNGLTRGGGHAADLAATLSALVAKGTITQAQADAITAAATAAQAAKAASRVADHAAMDAERAATEALISKTIGVDSATIRTRLAAGESLGAIAGAKKAELISVLVADHTKRIDAAVTAGKLTAAQATTLKADLTTHVTAEVDRVGGKGAFGGKGGKGEKGGRGHGGPGHGGPGHGGPGKGGMGAAPTIPTPTASPAATA